MIEFEHLTYNYPIAGSRTTADSAPTPVLRDVSLHVDEGGFVLVVGPSGAGKSTLLRCINGLVPHFYGGTISGRVRVGGRDPVALEPRRMSEVVGFVFQDPETQAVVDVVEDELAFAMENQGLPATTMRQRVEEVLDQLGIAHLRRRQISTLSGGERQRVAIAAVLTLRPRVLVLDEPTSQLDPQAAEEVLDTLAKLNHDVGLTIVLSEHRLERVVQYAGQILYVPGSGESPIIGDPREVLARVPLVPPLIELGRRLGWSPLPLTIREARRFVPESWIQGHENGGTSTPVPPVAASPPCRLCLCPIGAGYLRHHKCRRDPSAETLAIEMQNVRFSYTSSVIPDNGSPTLQGIDLEVQQGEFVAIMGRNGAGKSTLLKQCIGLLKPDEGRVRVLGLDTPSTPVEELGRHVGYVPQNPNALLFADTVADELAFTRRAQGMPPADDALFLQTLGLSGMDQRYPRDLSVGERQRVALAAVLVGDPELILLDEPTRGLDYEQKAALVSFLQAQKRRGKTVVVATHDVELVAQCAERVVLMDDGAIVVDGPLREVMSGSSSTCGTSPPVRYDGDTEIAQGLSRTLRDGLPPVRCDGDTEIAQGLSPKGELTGKGAQPVHGEDGVQVSSSQINELFRDPRYLTVQDVVAMIQ